MKTLVTIPDEAINKIHDFRKEYYPHLSLGKFLVNCTIEFINGMQAKKEADKK